MTILQAQQRWNPEMDMSITYYLSGPMSGYENYNYPAFEKAAAVLRMTGLIIESPHENPWPAAHDTLAPEELWAHMMERCMVQMDRCQGMILMKGWPQSKGAREELQIAMQRDWPIWFYHDFMLTNMNRSNNGLG